MYVFVFILSRSMIFNLLIFSSSNFSTLRPFLTLFAINLCLKLCFMLSFWFSMTLNYAKFRSFLNCVRIGRDRMGPQKNTGKIQGSFILPTDPKTMNFAVTSDKINVKRNRTNEILAYFCDKTGAYNLLM